MVYPEALDSLPNKLNNIAEYNPETTIIIVHIDKKRLTQEILNKVNLFEKEKNIKVIINDELDYNNYKFKQVEYIMSNFNKLTQANINFDYIVFDNFDSLYVKHNSYSYIKKADIGMNFGKINGYWQDKIVSHKSLAQWANKHLNKGISDLSIKGAAQGMFIKKEIAKSVFDLLDQFLALCERNDDYPQYLSEEVLFQLMTLTLENRDGTIIKKHSTLTDMPWERKLQWTAQQVKDAQNGIGIPNNKFEINSIIG